MDIVCCWLNERRDDLSVLLGKAQSTLSVKLLLDTLAETMEFEASIVTRFGITVSRSAQAYQHPLILYSSPNL
jgi:hypothetical protein